MGSTMKPVEYKIDSNKMGDPAPQIGTYRKYAVFIQLGIKKEKNRLFVARITKTLPANRLRLAIVSLFEQDWFLFQLPIKISKAIKIKKKGTAQIVRSSISIHYGNF